MFPGESGCDASMRPARRDVAQPPATAVHRYADRLGRRGRALRRARRGPARIAGPPAKRARRRETTRSIERPHGCCLVTRRSLRALRSAACVVSLARLGLLAPGLLRLEL